ncbi:hypothetical protein GGQ22_10825 [Nocardioides sp. zg-579]|uniref:Uncharacterized protein n=1 Tax=Nocardioides marmotae TaxID=2663857 RepID=A0A6I3JC06_9ACTN|nr:hypothetical protein [Nocardioides marmotae]MCR6031939.1 hypothetical protein [Gordonia jinghuaiqii]MTB95579.1 hypothetical protein [Nocardioides marmotae]QKE00999.1 hypothetical protein HPC71_07885 [Nocardioides marmotae]
MPDPTSSVPVSVLWSHAHRADGAVRLVLVLPAEAPVVAAQVWLRLELGEAALRVPASVEPDEHGLRLSAAVPQDRLAAGLWRLRVRVGRGGPLLGLQARLLLAPDRPVALLPGPRPALRAPAAGGGSPY